MFKRFQLLFAGLYKATLVVGVMMSILICHHVNICLNFKKTEVVSTSNLTHVHTTFQMRFCLVTLRFVVNSEIFV